jgi:hypothetical protein
MALVDWFGTSWRTTKVSCKSERDMRGGVRPGTFGGVVLGTSFVLALVLAGAPCDAGAQAVAGRLLDMEAGTPIVLARMTLLDADSQVVTLKVTGADGEFLLPAPGPGRYWVRIESPFHEGYTDGPIALAEADTVVLTFEVMPRPIELEALTVEAEGRIPRLEVEGVYERSELRIGVHFDEQRLRDRPGTRVSELIALLPMVELWPDTAEAGSRKRVVFRRRQFQSLRAGDGTRPTLCFPQVFLNGGVLAIGGRTPGGLDEFSVNDLAAVEVYESPSVLPGRFSGPNAHCGTIVLWTR